MKATGIVRRIDELGRVVIPKEIRRTLRIKDGDPSLITLKGISDKKSENSQKYVRLRQNPALIEYLQAKGKEKAEGFTGNFTPEEIFMLSLRSLEERGYIKHKK